VPHFWWGEAPEWQIGCRGESSHLLLSSAVRPLDAPSRGLSCATARRVQWPNNVKETGTTKLFATTFRPFRSLAPPKNGTPSPGS